LPEPHVITGSNGAGKSTVGPEYLPPHIRKACTVFDGDKLTLEKTKAISSTKLHSHKEAKAIANEWVDDHFREMVEKAIRESQHFAYEGHFREDFAWKVIDRFKGKGYSVHMIFFGLVNVERSAMRVLERALGGGHNVSRAEIDLNYHGNLLQLDRHFKTPDRLRIIDSSETAPKILLELNKNKVVFNAQYYELPDWFTTCLINITRHLFPNI
jgi:predicted ABC-type ATPase